MRTVVLKDILAATFRANPRYELVLFDHLPQAQQEALSDLQKDSDFYGILRPRGQPGLGIKSVCRDTALLYLTLREPSALPAYVKTIFGEQCNQAVAELVLDDVLEVEWNGGFVTGSEAYELIYEQGSSPTILGCIARLSFDALKYGQALELQDSRSLSMRLYQYNRLPISPFWKQKFPTPDAVAEHLGIQAHGPVKALLDLYWTQTLPSSPYDGWNAWESGFSQPVFQNHTNIYKLYVSPHCEYMREVFQAAVEVLSQVRAPRFKVGKNVSGLLRPDKMVAYFQSFEALAEAAERLRNRLEGVPPQGVPFTAEIAGDGLISWGIDPPAEQQALGWQEHESWRLWVTNRLAVALLAAKASQSRAVEPWQFAVERLRLEGVNTDSWTPAKTMWQTNPLMEG